MASGSKVLSDASGTYTAFDVGKLAVVNGAGAPVNEAAKLSATLSTGAPVTTLVVSALAAAFPSGPLTIEQEGHTQQFFCEGAAAGATALPVTSQTPSFAFTAAATIKSWGRLSSRRSPRSSRRRKSPSKPPPARPSPRLSPVRSSTAPTTQSRCRPPSPRRPGSLSSSPAAPARGSCTPKR